MKMSYADFSDKAKKIIDTLAEKSGVTRDEVVRQFEMLFAGRGVSKHSKRVFTA